MPNRENQKFAVAKKPSVMAGLRMPPQNIEAERSILGAILIDKDAIIKIADIIDKDDFYDNRHGMIYDAMANLFEKRMPIDIVTLSEILETAGQIKEVGGSSYLAEIVNSTPSAANIVHYAQIVRDKGILRRLISAGSFITETGYDEESEIAVTLDQAEQTLFAVSQSSLKNKFSAIRDILTEAFDRIDKIHKDKDKGALRGVSSGFKGLDGLTAGFQKSDLIILAARPSMGKTSFALNLAENAAIDDKMPVAIFSLEMSKDQLVDRLLASQASVDSWKLRTGNLSDDDFPKIGYAMGVLSEAPIYIDDAPSANIMEIRAKARRMQMEHGLGLIIVDYLQLMSGHSRNTEGNRVQEISEISRGLKGLARELNVPIVALSQLSRAVEHRDDKRPQLSDLRESGCLAGDTLIFDAKTGQRTPIRELVDKELNILALNDKLKLQTEKASRVFKTGRKKLFEIVLASGRKIKATANHQFMSFEGWKRLDHLAVGEHLATPRLIPSSDFAGKELSDDQLIVLAHLIGDGCFLARQPLHYTSADVQSIECVNRSAKAAFGTVNRIVRQKSWFHLYLSSPEKLTHGKRNPICRWLDEEMGIFDQHSHEKRIPRPIFGLSKGKVALFIKHLFATDGGLSKSAGIWRLHYASNSRGLIEDLAHLLLRFEIASTIKVNQKGNYKPGYDLIISGRENQLRFFDEISIFGAREAKIVQAQADLANIKTNPNNDIIPAAAWQKVKLILKNQGLTHRLFHSMMGWAYSGTQRYGNGLSRSRLMSIAQRLNSAELSDLASSEIYWDKIKSINPLGIEEVFDITVPENHNFVANDIIVHNSIEQDADVVMFLYREEYYHPETDKKGITEILIRKHRNGPTGNLELFFNPSQMRFSDIERRRESVGQTE